MMSDNNFTKTDACVICQESSDRKCPGCELVFYCNCVHQQQNWEEHQKICRPFQVSFEPKRCLIATRDLQRGDEIFSEKPLVFGPKSLQIREGPFPCVGCCRNLYNENCSRCSICFWPVCDPECGGLKVPNRHGFECNILKLRPLSRTESFYEYFRFDILIILRGLYLQTENNDVWNEFLQLDHFDWSGPDSEIFKKIDEKAHFLKKRYLNPLELHEKETGLVILPENSIDLIHKIYAILEVNAIELSDIDAMLLYHKSSLLEHNCTPNTMQIINEKNSFEITFRSSIPIQKGAHINTIHTNILWGTPARRAHLKRTKNFRCSCNRCQDPTEFGTYLSALKCLGSEKDPCGGMQLPVNPCEENCYWICDKCNIKLPNEDVMKFVDHLNSIVDRILSRKTNIEELEDMLTKLLNFLNPHHYLIYLIKHSLLQLYGKDSHDEVPEKMLHHKLGMCEDLKKIIKIIDPGNSRLSLYLGVLLNEELICRSTLLQRMFDGSNELSLNTLVKDISDLCDQTEDVLRYEVDTHAGRRLACKFEKNRIEFNKWLKECNILV